MAAKADTDRCAYQGCDFSRGHHPVRLDDETRKHAYVQPMPKRPGAAKHWHETAPTVHIMTNAKDGRVAAVFATADSARERAAVIKAQFNVDSHITPWGVQP